MDETEALTIGKSQIESFASCYGKAANRGIINMENLQMKKERSIQIITSLLLLVFIALLVASCQTVLEEPESSVLDYSLSTEARQREDQTGQRIP